MCLYSQREFKWNLKLKNLKWNLSSDLPLFSVVSVDCLAVGDA